MRTSADVNGAGGPHARSLPRSDSPSLALGHPTAEEAQHQSSQNAVAWSGALTLEAYLRREAFLSEQSLTREDGVTFWILYDTNEDVAKRRVLAGCETLRKRALVKAPGSEGVEEMIAHGVGSVFTPPAFRGHGYGGRMMSELSRRLETHQTEERSCIMSVLYSDIGKKFYAKFGWQPFPSSHVSLSPKSVTQPLQKGVPQPTPLYAKDLQELCKRDEELVRRRLSRHKTGYAVALAPDHRTIEWHHAREEFIGVELHGRKPIIKGGMIHVGSDRAWVIWTRVWTNPDPQAVEDNTLHVLRLVVDRGEGEGEPPKENTDQHRVAMATLLQFAQREAYHSGMQAVELWAPGESAMAAMRMVDEDAEVVERDSESITSLKWYGPEGAEVEWLENEKYGWC